MSKKNQVLWPQEGCNAAWSKGLALMVLSVWASKPYTQPASPSKERLDKKRDSAPLAKMLRLFTEVQP